VLLAEPEFGSGEAIWALAERLACRGLGVIPVQTTRDVRETVAEDSWVGAMLLGWDMFGSEHEFDAILDDLRDLGTRPPVVLLSEQAAERGIPPAAAQRADGSFWLPADSPSFVAAQVEQLVRAHAEQLVEQFLAELTGSESAADWISYLPGPDGRLMAAGDAARWLGPAFTSGSDR
jgi:hypothetical protein